MKRNLYKQIQLLKLAMMNGLENFNVMLAIDAKYYYRMDTR